VTRRRVAVVACLLAVASVPLGAQERFSFFYPSSPESVQRLLTLAALRDDALVLDLGSGDGLIPLTAAKVNAVATARGGLFRAVAAAHVDVPLALVVVDADTPGLAADLAILHEGA
jgi:predicted RNA methylase